MMRIPRKLKKGCRTLHGKPRTKWQRQGQLHLCRLFEDIGKTAATAALSMDVLRQASERIMPPLPAGGIALPPPQRMMVGESTGEIVLHRPQLDRLKHVVMIDPMDGVRATMPQMNFSDIFEKISHKKEEPR
jgi:hypothetical protein